jgi:uncharacterized membrane protein
MQKNDVGRRPFQYIMILTGISIVLILLNVALGMRIPFKVDFLLFYVLGLMVFVTWHSVLTKGWRRSLIMFIASFVVAFTAEAMGVNFGLVFGKYYYTEVLGVQLFGVPLLAALAWEPIVYAAFCISDLVSPLVSGLPGVSGLRPSIIWPAVIGALATTAWDMMIDPIAVSQGWWVWVEGGPYVPYVANGVPIQNFIGWLVVAFSINLLYRFLAERAPHPPHNAALTYYGPLMLYASLFLTSFGVTITILERPEVALIGLLAMGPFLAITLANIGVIRRAQGVALVADGD